MFPGNPLLTKQNLNYATVNKSDASSKFVKGSTVPYNVLKHYLQEGATEESLTSAIIGKRLGGEYMHLTTGTVISASVLEALKAAGIKKVKVTKKKLEFTPFVKPIDQIPLMSTDWVSRLGHRRLKDTLTKAPAEVWDSDTRGTSPYPSLVYGAEDFGKKINEGHY